VVRSTVQLAHELGLEVAAEGVADAASLAVLADLGCDHVQGAHLSPPVTIDELADRVESLESALAGWVASAEATLG
jgi:EAL domain-containing protein (putative c-di-GMP-specific phosphodiesterase class I)